MDNELFRIDIDGIIVYGNNILITIAGPKTSINIRYQTIITVEEISYSVRAAGQEGIVTIDSDTSEELFQTWDDFLTNNIYYGLISGEISAH